MFEIDARGLSHLLEMEAVTRERGRFIEGVGSAVTVGT
jgi:hypothetical protein